MSTRRCAHRVCEPRCTSLNKYFLRQGGNCASKNVTAGTPASFVQCVPRTPSAPFHACRASRGPSTLRLALATVGRNLATAARSRARVRGARIQCHTSIVARRARRGWTNQLTHGKNSPELHTSSVLQKLQPIFQKWLHGMPFCHEIAAHPWVKQPMACAVA